MPIPRFILSKTRIHAFRTQVRLKCKDATAPMIRRTRLATAPATVQPAHATARMHVPPREERQRRTLTMCPVNRQVHPDRALLNLLQDSIAEIFNTIAESETLTMQARPNGLIAARQRLSCDVELRASPPKASGIATSGRGSPPPEGALAVNHLQFHGWGQNMSTNATGRSLSKSPTTQPCL